MEDAEVEVRIAPEVRVWVLEMKERRSLGREREYDWRQVKVGVR